MLRSCVSMVRHLTPFTRSEFSLNFRSIFQMKLPVPLPQLRSTIMRRLNLASYEPPYLESMRPKLPIYEAITVQIKGYDFPPLETFQSFAHSVAEFLNLKVEEWYCFIFGVRKLLFSIY